MSLFGQLTKQKKIKNARSSKKNKSSSSKKIVMKKATFRIWGIARLPSQWHFCITFYEIRKKSLIDWQVFLFLTKIVLKRKFLTRHGTFKTIFSYNERKKNFSISRKKSIKSVNCFYFAFTRHWQTDFCTRKKNSQGVWVYAPVF